MDTTFFHAINGWAGQSALLDWLMLQCSSSRNFVVLILAYLAYRVWLDWRQGVVVTAVLGAAVGAGDFIGSQLKLWIARPRPCQVLLNVNELTGCGGLFSLPSNHAVNAATAAAFSRCAVPFDAMGWRGPVDSWWTLPCLSWRPLSHGRRCRMGLRGAAGFDHGLSRPHAARAEIAPLRSISGSKHDCHARD